MKAKDWIATVMFRILELSFVIAFFILLAFICTKEIPAANKDLANILFGGLLSCVLGIAGYEWGSSRGSERKTEIMAGPDMTAKQTTETTTANTAKIDD